MVTLESIALFGAFLWGGAALVTGVPRGLVPSEVPFLFTIPAIIGALLGATGWTAGRLDAWLLFAAAAVYLAAPIVLSAWLLHRRETEDRDPENPKTIT